MDLLPIRPVEFDRLVEFDRARNTAQIGLKFMDLHPGRIGYHPNDFTPILSSISCPVEFDRSNSTGRIGSKSMNFNPN